MMPIRLRYRDAVLKELDTMVAHADRAAKVHAGAGREEMAYESACEAALLRLARANAAKVQERVDNSRNLRDVLIFMAGGASFALLLWVMGVR